MKNSFGQLVSKSVVTYIKCTRRQYCVYVERNNDFLYIEAGRCLLRVADSPAFFPFFEMVAGAQEIEVTGHSVKRSGKRVSTRWTMLSEQFDLHCVQQLRPTRWMGQTDKSMFRQFVRERDSEVWVPKEVTDMFALQPDDLRAFRWEIGPIRSNPDLGAMIRVMQSDGLCVAMIMPALPAIY